MRKPALYLTSLLAVLGTDLTPGAHPLGAGVRGGLRSASAAPPPVSPSDDRIQRKAIRGHSVDFSRESPELRELREFEQATFPRGGLRGGEGPGEERDPRDDLKVGGVGAGRDREEGGAELLPDAMRTPSPTRRAGQAPPPPSMPWLASLRLLDNLGLSSTFVRFETHVLKYLEFYKEEKRGRSIMGSWLRRQGRYRGLIEEVLDRHQLPRFLLYISMIESGYDPHDRSTAGAVGLWQFLPEGARIYGLRVDYWIDQRKDPVLSTEAAARYLGDLKARFGSWHLALAAFNAGYGAVLRAMQKYNTNDYWELCRHEDGLPWETLLYVPKAIATALVGENRGVFGYEDLPPDPALSYDEVRVSSSVNLAAAARAVGAQPADLERLNPELRRGRTPPLTSGQSWPLRLPKGTAARYADSYDPRGEKLDSYVVRFGERLEDIARARGVSLRDLRRLNGVEESVEVRAGVTLLVPAASGKGAASAAPPPPLPGGEVVIVAVPDKSLSVPGRKRVFYRVISGDTISGIARFFKVTQGELSRWNNLDLDATLATRMVLDIWVDPAFDTSQVALVEPARVRVVTTGSEEFFDLVETLRGRRRVVYLCKAGDTLQKVGKRYGLTAADLERINRLGKSSELRAGQSLMVYVPMSEREKEQARRKLVPGGADQGGVIITDVHDGAEDADEDEGAEEKGEKKAAVAEKKAAAPVSDKVERAEKGEKKAVPVSDKVERAEKGEKKAAPVSDKGERAPVAEKKAAVPVSDKGERAEKGEKKAPPAGEKTEKKASPADKPLQPAKAPERKRTAEAEATPEPRAAVKDKDSSDRKDSNDRKGTPGTPSTPSIRDSAVGRVAAPTSGRADADSDLGREPPRPPSQLPRAPLSLR